LKELFENNIQKDWTGNKASVYKTIGASNHTEEDRQRQDYYATEPKATQILLRVEKFNKNIWECACGEGHISRVLLEAGYNVRSTDLVDRGFGEEKDFLFFNDEKFNGDIITNPPYSRAKEFVERSLEVIPKGNKVAMFLKLTFLEGQDRKQFFINTPPHIVYVSSSRLLCAKNGEFDKTDGSAVAYAWFIWIKGFRGDTVIKWIN
jgi:hypothetical protein